MQSQGAAGKWAWKYVFYKKLQHRPRQNTAAEKQANWPKRRNIDGEGAALRGTGKKTPENQWLSGAEVYAFLSACWTSRGWCHPCQTPSDFFAFRLIFGLILRFFCTPDSNFHPRAWRTKNRFCSLYVPCVSLPRATQDNSGERNLVAVLVITPIFQTSELHKSAG